MVMVEDRATGQVEPPRPSGPRIALVVGAVVLLLGVTALVAVLLGGGRHDRAGAPGSPAGPSGAAAGAPGQGGTPNGRTATAGWRLEASLGLEIEVPAGWDTNNTLCNQTDAPSVVRDLGATPACLTLEPTNKSVAELTDQTDQLTPGLPRQTVTLGGVAVQRAQGRLADGRYAGSIVVPGRGALTVRTLDEALTTHILDSLRLADTDHLGCANARPAGLSPARPAGDPASFVPTRVSEIDVCHYGDTYPESGRNTGAGSPLLSSTAITGAGAQALADALNTAVPGRNPDSDACLDQGEPRLPDAVLWVRPAAGPAVPVYLSSALCWQRGYDNGASAVQVSWPLLQATLSPLHTGYSASGPIPGFPDSGGSASAKPATR